MGSGGPRDPARPVHPAPTRSPRSTQLRARRPGGLSSGPRAQGSAEPLAGPGPSGPPTEQDSAAAAGTA